MALSELDYKSCVNVLLDNTAEYKDITEDILDGNAELIGEIDEELQTTKRESELKDIKIAGYRAYLLANGLPDPYPDVVTPICMDTSE